MRSLSILLIILLSCTVPDKASLTVMSETRKLQESPVILKAANQGNLTNDKLELRANNSFTYSSNVRGTQKIVIYVGTFDPKGDTLFLNFHNNHKDSLWTGMAVIDKAANTVTFLSKDVTSSKTMVINRRL